MGKIFKSPKPPTPPPPPPPVPMMDEEQLRKKKKLGTLAQRKARVKAGDSRQETILSTGGGDDETLG